MEEYRQLPRISKIYFTICFIVTALVSLDFVSTDDIYLNFRMVILYKQV